MSLKEHVPWQAKMATKLAISRLPLPNAFWSRIGIFRHGCMDNPDYAESVWRRHFESATFGRKGQGFVCLELGPGNSLFTAVFARMAGADKTWLVDSGAFVSTDVQLYKDAVGSFPADRTANLFPDTWNSIATMLEDCHAEYLTGGLESIQSLPPGTVDFIFSQAVLEHVRRYEFAPMIGETFRLLRDDGYSSHEIDIKDHLGKSLHSLRFRESIWESPSFANSGFYTNRLRHSEIVKIAEDVGFDVTTSRSVSWPTLPLPKSRLHKAFRNMTEEDLRISSFTVVLTPKKSPSSSRRPSSSFGVPVDTRYQNPQ